MRRSCVLLFLLPLSIVMAEDIPGGQPARLRSPSGKFDVGFQPQEQRLYAGPHERDLPAGVKCQVYSVSFYPTGKDSAVAVTYFTDIQATPESKFPTPLNQIAKKMLWSPDDDFVVLPKEDWHQKDSEPAIRQAVSLGSSNSVWQTADFPLSLEPLIWITPLQVIGNTTQGCREEVKEFDGKSGRTLMFQSGDEPIGYAILSHEGSQVILQKVLGNCATAEDHQNFQRDCILMNLSFGRREMIACPQ